MKIMVFDVAAETGGALSILMDFYEEFLLDENEYYIVLSIPEIPSNNKIKVLNYPWIKKSWIHRLFFEFFIAPRLLRKHKIEKILSLQNIIVLFTKLPQILYIHNSLPFVKYKYKLRENPLLWVYQNVIGKMIIYSAKKASKVIVQSKWMKKVFIPILSDERKISVSPPKINLDIKNRFSTNKFVKNTFFYPASAVDFKNHKLIVEACLELKKMNVTNYKIYFTLDGDENQTITILNQISEENQLPIQFIGNLSREDVYKYYCKTILIFPSFIESSPLPLSEAKLHNTPILASDCNFSREILKEYSRVNYFNPFNKQTLVSLMKNVINNNELLYKD